MNALAWMGYSVLVVSALHLAFAVLLGTGSRRKSPLLRYTFYLASISAMYCLMAGLCYVRASMGLPYDLYYRAAWIGWMGVPAGLQIIYQLGDPLSRMPQRIGRILYPFWGLVVLLCVTTDYFERPPDQLYPLLDNNGPLEAPTRLIGAVQLIWALIVLAQGRRRNRGLKRLKIDYMLMGLVIFALGGIALSGPFSLPGSFLDPSMASYLSLPWAATTFYAVTRTRLFDIRIIVSRLISVIMLTTIFTAFQLAFFHLLVSDEEARMGMVVTTLASAVLLFVSPLRSVAVRFSNALVSPDRQSYQQVLKESSRTLASILNVDDLLRALLDITRQQLGVECAAVLLQEGKDEADPLVLRSSFGPMPGLPGVIPHDSPLLYWLKEHKKVLIREEQSFDVSLQPRQVESLESMAAAGVELAVPLVSKGQLTGILVTGAKLSREAFLQRDIDLLETLVSQAAVALDNARLFEEAITDGLTGLFHQKYFKNRLRAELERARRHRQPLALLLLDIDRFKTVNDTYGHLMGDQILRQVALVIQGTLRGEDIAARYGGEEFAVVLLQPDPARVGEIADRLRLAIAQVVYPQGLSVTVSIGVTIFDPKESSSTELSLIQEADEALYLAKRSGRDRVELSPMAQAAARRNTGDPADGLEHPGSLPA